MAKKGNKEKKKTQKEINRENLQSGISIIYQHPLFKGCTPIIHIANKTDIGTNTMCIVHSDGTIKANEDYTLSPKQWSYVLAHNILHLAFGHFDAEKMPGYCITLSDGTKEKKIECDIALWNMACDIYITKFLADIKFGQPINNDNVNIISGTSNDEAKIYQSLCDQKISATHNHYGTAAMGTLDMKGLDKPLVYNKAKNQYNTFTRNFSIALANSVSDVISEAGGHSPKRHLSLTIGQRAANWFIDHYPLLGGLASHFKIIEDTNYCNRNDIHIAAIDVVDGEIYLNPNSNLSEEEWKFVLAHEYLHAGLQHHNRCNGRNQYLWNVACDFVINSWLVELQVGVMPADGLLYDAKLSGLSAESIYDILLENMRKYEKLGTFRGFGKGDIIGDKYRKEGMGNVTLDEFCKNALSQGLEYHQSTGRGLIPAGLIEEIRSLAMPPIPWDVALAKWFDIYFAPLEKHRTYSRPSRRQASTPDIPRPRYTPADIPTDSRTFGVVIDTSGSMDAKTIGKALGTIASYSVSHDVCFVRVIFCDAAAYDAGYISPEDIAGRVAVKGRGGTILQPGIDALESAKDFPKDGPILIITDGEIEDHLDIKHEHAFLLPQGARLPFRPRGEVFYFRE
ncbi:MAG: hypothetical protein IKJ73_09745 [Lachnospiraceae bacterium]|nr:hypothetical protein [Lachnospiraceae bacterium]